MCDKWARIETAPKGIIVDLWTSNGRVTNCHNDSIYGWLDPNSQFVKGVTHWMPLPPPPQGSEEQEPGE